MIAVAFETFSTSVPVPEVPVSTTASQPAARCRRPPRPDETAEAVRRAQRALVEIHHCCQTEERHAADEAARDDELARWHAADTSNADPATQPRPSGPPRTAAQ
jgi:hypothetical protein